MEMINKDYEIFDNRRYKKYEDGDYNSSAEEDGSIYFQPNQHLLDYNF
jgi:hypothetical protein